MSLFIFLSQVNVLLMQDSEAAYKCLKERYGTKQEDIILYGQSVGSGRTVDFAARLPRLRAIVLHSPILEDNRAVQLQMLQSAKEDEPFWDSPWALEDLVGISSAVP